MKFINGTFIGEEVIIELSKDENLMLRKALNKCKKEDIVQIQLNRGNYFIPFILGKGKKNENCIK
ncbi:hypothetical protein [Lactococcus lactis]|uniref:Uncharacterized protein n=1 Tax=Lactococcus lactis TaxID=1358 RepID=A0AAW5TQM3_9LACT|nr:hypothetical protein [Lactococcus lactis]MCW2279894.1 hypothetical protein [Lactococcus lactis]